MKTLLGIGAHLFCNIKDRKVSKEATYNLVKNITCKKFFVKCSAGQPQVPGRGFQLEKWWWSCRSWASHQLPACRFQNKSPMQQINRYGGKQQYFLNKPVYSYIYIFFQCIKELNKSFTGERLFSFFGNEWYACSDHFYNSFKATCLRIVTIVAVSWAALDSVFYHGAVVAQTMTCTWYIL